MKSLMLEEETATVGENVVRIHPEDIALLAGQIAGQINGVLKKQDQLLNLTELAQELGIPYSTLSKKALPHQKLDRKGRKMYRVRDIENHLAKFRR
jgi:hypothetical protein